MSSRAAQQALVPEQLVQLYTSCCNATQGIYYYTTYDNHQISAVDMHRENLDGETLRCFAPVTGEQIHMQN